MSIINKKPTASEKVVLFRAILDRRGCIPKTEKKMMNQKFLEKFVQYADFQFYNIKDPINREVCVSVINLFKDFGKNFVINHSNISYFENFLEAIRYCKLSNRLSSNDWYQLLTNNTTYNKYIQWNILMATAIVSTHVTDSQLISICNVYGMFWEVDSKDPHSDNSSERDTFETYVHWLVTEVRFICNSYDHWIRTRLALSIIHVYDSIRNIAISVNKEDVKRIIKEAIYVNALRGDYAPVIPKYYNPFTFQEYYDMVVFNGLEPEFRIMDEYLDPIRCDKEFREERLKELCASNGNNLRFARTKQEIALCITTINSSNSNITDYNVFKKAYPNGVQESIMDKFIGVGDLSTIPSDDIPAVFNHDEKIRIVAGRSDAKEQYIHMLRKPNGIIYLSSAIKYLSYDDLDQFMKAYVDYMETVDDYREDGVSMDLYMASYIKKSVSMETIIQHCPGMLQYIDLTITELPSDYAGLNEWIQVARFAPVINLTDGSLFQKITRLDAYVPLNYHHVAFSAEMFGIEEIITDSKELCKLIDSHPGYYFDIKDSKVKSILLEYLVEKVS